MEVLFKEFNFISEKGLPSNHTICIIIFGKENKDYFIGQYSEENHNFYVNFGDGGFVVNETDVIAWKELNKGIINEFKWK